MLQMFKVRGQGQVVK